MIDYERMKRAYPKQKARLTRAKNKFKGDPESIYYAVEKACIAAVSEWNQIGAWPDNWSNWQRALDDAYLDLQCAPLAALLNKRPDHCPRLGEWQ
jgi:hypothetical protein